MRSLADIGANVTWTAVATRGQRLVLSRFSSTNKDLQHGEFDAEMLSIIEIDTAGRIVAGVLFDPDDIVDAIEELDARYLAGEAAVHSETWSVIVASYAAIRRRELPATTTDFVDVDHRALAPIGPGDLKAYIWSTMELTQNFTTYIEAVHRLSLLGAVLTHVGIGTSDGFDAEWRMVIVAIVEGDRLSRFEIFDETDRDAALARFDELNHQVPQLENAASRAWARQAAAFNRRDLGDFLALTTADCRVEDRRKGLRAMFEGPARVNAAQATFEAPAGWRLDVQPIAIRGAHFALSRTCWRDASEPDQPITVELLALTEVGDGDLIRSTVSFDPDDINGAFAELTARWIASGEVEHPQAIEAHLKILQVLNRHDWDTYRARLADATGVNHRQLGAGATIADFIRSVDTVASLIPNFWVEPTNILRYSVSGAVGDLLAKGTSSDGADVEIPMLMLGLFDGDRLTHLETFDPDQRDLALARFDELTRPT